MLENYRKVLEGERREAQLLGLEGCLTLRTTRWGNHIGVKGALKKNLSEQLLLETKQKHNFICFKKYILPIY